MSKKQKQHIDFTKQWTLGSKTKAIIHANNELNKQLEFLTSQAGKVWTETVVRYWRILRKKNIFLSKTAMQKLVKNDELQSHTVQGIIDCFYDSIKGFIEARKANPKARMPRKLRFHYPVVYKLDAIHQKKDYLEFSNGTKQTEECESLRPKGRSFRKTTDSPD